MRLPKKNEVLENLHVEDIANKGKGLTRYDNLVIFVEDVVPGDQIDVRITKRKKSYLEGKPVQFNSYSDDRTEPFCEHFELCGGCKWQHITYEAQLKLKQKYVYDNLTRLGKVDDFEYRDIFPAPDTRYYRNRLDFAFTNKRWLTDEEKDSGEVIDNRNGIGLHIPGRFDKVLNINHCYLQKDPSNPIRLSLKTYAEQQGYSFYDILNNKGLLRSLIIRTTNQDDTMVTVMFGEEDEKAIQDIMHFLHQHYPQVTSLYYVINEKANDTFYDLPAHHFDGNPYIEENIDGLKLRLGPKSFYQTNSKGAKQLFDIVQSLADVKPYETIYDLYTGIGSIALYLAHQARQVIGIETVPEAIDYANENARVNAIQNTQFFTGEMRNILDEDFIANYGQPDVLVTDPPRDGMHPKVVKTILKVAPDRIVYVSCNPSTQARDLAELKEYYDVVVSQPVDMFPHTFHVENVLLLTRKNEYQYE